jgi:H+/gluconate symporter-like permease
MPANGLYLVAITIAAIGLMLALILVLKLHAFLALMVSSMALGLAAHMTPAEVLKSIQFGFGDALGFIAVVVALGAMIGRFLEYSGGGIELADWLLAIFGRDRAVWAVLGAAYLVGLPIYFEVGFIIMVPLVWNLARESRRSVLLYGLPMAMALSVTHNLIPPHPWSGCGDATPRGRSWPHHLVRVPALCATGGAGRHRLRMLDLQTDVHRLTGNGPGQSRR